MRLMRAGSSSSLPLSMLASSSRLKWVNRPSARLVCNESAATNMPDCVMSWARPMLRRKVCLPPWLAPDDDEHGCVVGSEVVADLASWAPTSTRS